MLVHRVQVWNPIEPAGQSAVNCAGMSETQGGQKSVIAGDVPDCTGVALPVHM